MIIRTIPFLRSISLCPHSLFVLGVVSKTTRKSQRRGTENEPNRTFFPTVQNVLSPKQDKDRNKSKREKSRQSNITNDTYTNRQKNGSRRSFSPGYCCCGCACGCVRSCIVSYCATVFCLWISCQASVSSLCSTAGAPFHTVKGGTTVSLARTLPGSITLQSLIMQRAPWGQEEGR